MGRPSSSWGTYSSEDVTINALDTITLTPPQGNTYTSLPYQSMQMPNPVQITYAPNTTLGDSTFTIGSGGSWDIVKNNHSLEVKGDANFEGDITLKGKSLVDALDKIEKRLAILHPNAELEGRWEALRALGEQYREMEAQLLEGEAIWSTLKK